jgi:uncharacterized BrkB/YihY/UPF0761 family membrane protein
MRIEDCRRGVRSAYVRRVARAWPDVRRRGVRAGFHGAIRFVVRDGSYHAAALTYYSILAVFPAGALVYGLLGLVGAESVVNDAIGALERRDVESQFADLWPGYDTNYGLFATLIVAVIWLWLTNVSVLLGGAFAAEWERTM